MPDCHLEHLKTLHTQVCKFMHACLQIHVNIHTHVHNAGSDTSPLPREQLEKMMSELLQRQEDRDEKMMRRLDYIESSLSRPIIKIPTSIHDADYIQAAVGFYGARKCCLTERIDPKNPGEEGCSQGMAKGKKTDEEKLADTLNVNAAHLIGRTEVNMYIKVNKENPKKKALTPKSPRAAILLTKKFEVLLDMYLWTLIPADPASSAPRYVVHVFAKKDAAWDVLRTTLNSFYLKHVNKWLEEIHALHGKEICFEETKCPSFRAVSHHAEQAVRHAKDNGWIELEQALALKSFSALSPLHSPAASSTFQNSVSLQDDVDDTEE